MAVSDASAFWMVFLFVFFVNILIPPIAIGLGQSVSERDATDADVSEAPSFSIGSIFVLSGINILAVPFWTIGLPTYLNLFIMIPVRVLAWYLFLRMIRGN